MSTILPPPFRSARASFAAYYGPIAALFLFALALGACAPATGPGSVGGSLPASDLSPPLLLDAGPTGARAFSLLFDEQIEAVAGSFALEPASAELCPSVDGARLDIAFSADQEPGRDYALAGEVSDGHGNLSRFLVNFVGWNDRIPTLHLSELQTAKNSSTLHPHRDFVELAALSSGNMGGVELEWCSTVRVYSYRFPGIEVAEGERIVLHLAPEGIAEELDETGADLALSGGVDATATGRDLWSGAGGLPDESGVVALRRRPGGEIVDGLFYGADDKSGQLADDKIGAAVSELVDAGIWSLAGTAGAWEDAFVWHPSVSRSLNRTSDWIAGAAGWYLSATSGQTPGAANQSPP